MSRYAFQTSVSADRSRSEIEKTLVRYCAKKFMYGWDGRFAVVVFEMNERVIRFQLPMPDKSDQRFVKTPTGRKRRNPNAALAVWEQSTRQRWRALLLVIKAKLEAVESGISNFESEFLANIMLPNNQTVGEWAVPQLEGIYASRKIPALLPGTDVK